MKVWRTTTELREGESFVADRTELAVEKVRSEAQGAAPGLAAARIDLADDPSRRWMIFRFPAHTETGPHSTPTVDFVTVIDGELDLIVPGEAPVRLRQGDCVLQQGALHIWRTTDAPAVVSAVVFKNADA